MSYLLCATMKEGGQIHGSQDSEGTLLVFFIPRQSIALKVCIMKNKDTRLCEGSGFQILGRTLDSYDLSEPQENDFLPLANASIL